MPTLSEIQFVRGALLHKRSQGVENRASMVAESNRFPDPYIYRIRNGKLTTVRGRPVEDYMEKKSYLGEKEYAAFSSIQEWVMNSGGGLAIWPNPNFGDFYPVSKVIVSEVIDLGIEKVLFNRTIIVDVDGVTLARWASELAGEEIIDPERLRSTALFASGDKTWNWLGGLQEASSQARMIKTGEDLRRKSDTYEKIEDILSSSVVYGEDRFGQLMGIYLLSCEKMLGTPFTVMSEFGEKFVKSCPFCNRSINKSISAGFRCECGEVYEGKC